jgi:putative transposase
MARRRSAAEPLGTIWRVNDELWTIIQKVLAELDPPHRGHRSRIDPRMALDGMIYHLRTGCQWSALPAEFGDDSSVHRTMQRWIRNGVLAKAWGLVVQACDELGAVEWTWQSFDCALSKARHGGGAVGPNPTDRAKNGTKRGVLTEGDGGPVAVVIAPANDHDSLLLPDGLEAVVVPPPNPHTQLPQHLCLDKAFDGKPSEATALVYGYQPHIRRIGEEKLDRRGRKRRKARRWVVERTIAWLNRCRAILVRWAKKGENYLGLIQLACTLLWYRRLWRLCN